MYDYVCTGVQVIIYIYIYSLEVLRLEGHLEYTITMN